MAKRGSYLVCFVAVVGLALGLAFGEVVQDQEASTQLSENNDQVLISPDLKDKPQIVYRQLRQYLQQNRREGDGVGGYIDGLGTLTVQQVVGACRSLEGDCDVTDLGVLDEKVSLTEGEDSEDWTEYTRYCRNEWLSRCNATETMIKQIGVSFSRDEWMNTRDLVDAVLREQPVKKDPQALDIHYRYPQGVVKFMRAKEGKLDDMLQMKKGKRDLFKRRFIELVRPVCKQAVSSLKHVVQGLKWAYDGVIPADELGPTVESALKIFRICLKILLEESALIHFSYDVFVGKRKGLMEKFKSKALSSLGADK